MENDASTGRQPLVGTVDLCQRLRETCAILWREVQQFQNEKDPIILERMSFYLEIIICFLERLFSYDDELVTLFRRVLTLVLSFDEIQQYQYSSTQFPGQLHNNEGCLGRPKIVISQEQLEEFLNMDFDCPTIAKLFGISLRTLRRRMTEYGLKVSSHYSVITDAELDRLVMQLKHEYPSCGYRIMLGLLRVRGIRIQQMRVRKSMQRIDPCGAVLRWFDTIHRRTYHVLGPLSLWHLDGNHKLIRYN